MVKRVRLGQEAQTTWVVTQIYMHTFVPMMIHMSKVRRIPIYLQKYGLLLTKIQVVDQVMG